MKRKINTSRNNIPQRNLIDKLFDKNMLRILKIMPLKVHLAVKLIKVSSGVAVKT
jgi:hypothetical protein